MFVKGVTRLWFVAAIVGLLVVPAPPPAHGCSCVGQGDLQQAIAESEAAFVGTLVDKSDGFGTGDATYTFEVEQWVKADLGPIIEVRSPSQGSACGFEVEIGERMGAFLSRDGNHLRGSLCTTVDPDALIAAASGPVASSTGVPRIVVSFNGGEVVVLDAMGRRIRRLEPPPELTGDWGGGGIDVCPDGRTLLQHTPTSVLVWDMAALEIRTSYTEGDGERTWITDASCRSEDASSIWVILQTENASTLRSLTPEPADLMGVPSPEMVWGDTNGIVVDYEFGTVTLLDLEELTTAEIWSRDPDLLMDGSAVPNPSDDTVALLETRFYAGERDPDAVLTILDARTEPIMEFEIPYESREPTWVDEERVMLTAIDWSREEESFGYLLEVLTGDVGIYEDWRGHGAVVVDGRILSYDGPSITSLNPQTGEVEILTAMPTQGIESMAVLAPDLPPAGVDEEEAPDNPGPTTPPLSVDDGIEGLTPDVGRTSTVQARWILAGLALFAGLAFWRFRASPRD